MRKPSYPASKSDNLSKTSEFLYSILKRCVLCGWRCKVNRFSQKGRCNSGVEVKISSFGPHSGEERIISGFAGSGTIFFTNCSMSCVFCQNYEISQLHQGYNVSEEELADIMLNLQNQGCHNINFVTPTHYLPQIYRSGVIAIEKGLSIPFVYNCGGYENPEIIKKLIGFIDIYMPDIKYGDNKTGEKYSGIPDYCDNCFPSVIEMKKQVGDITLDKNGIAEKGLLVRHLILPDNIENSKNVLKFIKENLGENTWISLLKQYHPEFKAFKFPEINRFLRFEEYEEICEYAEKIGLKKVIFQ